MGRILRRTARVLPVSDAGEVLLLLDRDPARPDVLRWGTVGGGVDPGESLVDAALRELHEETGIVAVADALIGPFHHDRRDVTFDGTEYDGDSTFFAMRLDRTVDVSFEHLEAAEVGIVLEARWWTPEDLAADGRLVAPDLPDIIRAAVTAAHAPADAGRTNGVT
jgi:8-oxo-dGTP pyrophosphatase MutT (NUDIX family)